MIKIKKRFILSAVAGILCCGPVAAYPSDVAAADNPQSSYQEYRRELLSGYNDFRSRLLEQYADFLNGEWHEYESLRAEVRDKTPKPKVAPTVDAPRSDNSPEALPPASGKELSTDPSPGNLTSSEKDKNVNLSSDEFSFYGLPVSMPRVDYNIRNRITSTQDFASNWRSLKDAGVASKVVPQLRALVDDMNLNGYLTFRLAENYVDAKFPHADAAARYSLLHFLLANMGYDVRIAVASSTNRPLLLIPFDEMVYGRAYMKIDGRRYFIFAPGDADAQSFDGQKIKTCHLPPEAIQNKKFDLVLSKLNIPSKPHKFNLSHGGITISGEVNENLMPILYHYPQMPMKDYALSSISPDLQRSIAAQVKSQLASLDEASQVESLLEFMHNVFQYATDEDYHGFEKPYFIEETLFYPCNDCEDRAIFYTWLLANALGRNAQLISYPGHESAAVELSSPIEGTSYTYDGKRYYISDPTYIGSHTGMVMPSYRGLAPQVDYSFHP